MKKSIIYSALLSLFISTHASSIELSKHLSTIDAPTPIARVSPKYPIKAAREGREGWANFSYIIEKDGSVSNIITTATSGSQDLSSAAKKAIMKWQYQPAMENGKPIQQCVNNVSMNFGMDSKVHASVGVSRKFKSIYNKAKKALEIDDLEQGQQHLHSLNKIKNLHLSENNFLQLLNAQYAKAVGDKALQLSHLHQIQYSDHSSYEKQKLFVLNQQFFLEVELNQFKSASRTYKRLEKLELAKPYMPQYQEVIEKVEQLVASNNNIIINANMRDYAYWHYPLLRNEFTLTDIQGTLTKMDIRCANKRHVYSIENNNTWKIPDTWKQCDVFIFGENNATFNLVEHPFQA